jgi:DUF2950 family protein
MNSRSDIFVTLVLRPIHRWILITLAVSIGFAGAFTESTRAQAPATPQRQYSSPEAAMDDLIAAVKSRDRDALRQIFGPDVQSLVSDDSVQQTNEFDAFADAVTAKSSLASDGADKRTMVIGNEEWPFPVPIVKRSDKWRFDTRAGVDELLTRRIGRDEMATILTCRAYALAQWDYFLDSDWDGDGVHEFAQKLISSTGQRDGLYWPTTENDDPSPLGPLVAQARFEGYSARDRAANQKATPFHGYYFKILRGQGPAAPGGRYTYVINGNMIGGFAAVAYPANYGVSGVMTFIINQQARVYQKDLGVNTATIAPGLIEYNPDASWKLVDQIEK